MRQLLDGQEYPVAKGDLIKNAFDHKADVDAADDNDSHGAINNTTQAPNASTYPEAENKAFVSQLRYGQEYPVAKGDMIKKRFYCYAAVERCVV